MFTVVRGLDINRFYSVFARVQMVGYDWPQGSKPQDLIFGSRIDVDSWNADSSGRLASSDG